LHTCSFGAEAFGGVLKIFHLCTSSCGAVLKQRCIPSVNVEAASYRVDFFADNGHGPDVLFLRAPCIDVKPWALAASEKKLITDLKRGLPSACDLCCGLVESVQRVPGFLPSHPHHFQFPPPLPRTSPSPPLSINIEVKFVCFVHSSFEDEQKKQSFRILCFCAGSGREGRFWSVVSFAEVVVLRGSTPRPGPRSGHFVPRSGRSNKKQRRWGRQPSLSRGGPGGETPTEKKNGVSSGQSALGIWSCVSSLV
jgi:hypothetical protein